MEMNKYIEPTKEHEGQMVEIRENNTEAWQEARLLRVLDQPQRFRFICEDSGSPELCNKWKCARIYVPKTYKELHTECSLKVGDWVKIVRKPEPREGGWRNLWIERMDPCVGACGEILETHEVYGFKVSLGGKDCHFPCFVLEKVEKPAPAEEEIVHVPGTVEHWIYKGQTYRMATASDLGKKCIVSDLSVKHALQMMCERDLLKVDSANMYEYRTNFGGWKYALIQDDSLLKPALKEEYVPYTWEDRNQLRGMWYRWKSNGCETPVGKMSQDSQSGALLVDYIDAQCLFKSATHLDENGNDTGIPFGKKVAK